VLPILKIRGTMATSTVIMNKIRLTVTDRISPTITGSIRPLIMDRSHVVTAPPGSKTPGTALARLNSRNTRIMIQGRIPGTVTTRN